MQISAKHALKLAIGAAALVGAAQANAFTAFQTSGPQSDELIIKGRVAYEDDWNKYGANRDDHDDSGSRTAIKYTHHFNEDFAVLGATEWGYNPFFRHGSETRNNKLNYYKRLQFAGVSYKGIGTLTYGKQASVYGMVTDATDQYWIFGAGANGKGGDYNHLVGADRPDDSLKYLNTFGDVTVGVMYGANDHDDMSKGVTRRHFDQAAVNWQIAPDVTVGTAYNHAAMKHEGAKDFDVEQYVVGATWTPGNWTFGAIVGQYNNELNAIKQARGYETFTQYAFKDLVSFGNVSVYGGLNRLEDRNGPARTSTYIVGTALKTHKGFGSSDNFIVAVEHVFNDSKNTSGHDFDAEGTNLDATSLLVRYNY